MRSILFDVNASIAFDFYIFVAFLQLLHFCALETAIRSAGVHHSTIEAGTSILSRADSKMAFARKEEFLKQMQR